MPNSGPAPGQVDYLVVAAGGGGGTDQAGGGGAGGYRTSFPGGTKLTITKGSTTPVTVGAGGGAGKAGAPVEYLQELMDHLQFFQLLHQQVVVVEEVMEMDLNATGIGAMVVQVEEVA
jgi:hypothetical protein